MCVDGCTNGLDRLRRRRYYFVLASILFIRVLFQTSFLGIFTNRHLQISLNRKFTIGYWSGNKREIQREKSYQKKMGIYRISRVRDCPSP